MTTRRKFLTTAAAGAAAVPLAAPAIAQSTITWRMQTYAGSALAAHVAKPALDSPSACARAGSASYSAMSRRRMGYHVIDFASLLDEYRALHQKTPSQQRKTTSPEKSRDQGLVLLSYNQHNGVFTRNRHFDPEAPRSEDYEYVIKPVQLSGSYGVRFFPWGDRQARRIASLLGSNIGVCVSQPQYDSQIEKKRKKDALLYIAEVVTTKVLTTPDIRTYVENQLGMEKAPRQIDQIMRIAKYSDVISNKLNLPTVKPEKDLDYFFIYEEISRYLDRIPGKQNPYNDEDWQKLVYDAREEVLSWQPSPQYEALADRIKNNRGLYLLDLYRIQQELKHLDKDNPDFHKKVFIETTVLNALNI